MLQRDVYKLEREIEISSLPGPLEENFQLSGTVLSRLFCDRGCGDPVIYGAGVLIRNGKRQNQTNDSAFGAEQFKGRSINQQDILLRRAAANPAKPVPKRSMAAGSGTGATVSLYISASPCP